MEATQTTITTETMQVQNLHFTITTFEQTVFAFCDVCETTDEGAAEHLKQSGWFLGKYEQFCPKCND